MQRVRSTVAVLAGFLAFLTGPTQVMAQSGSTTDRRPIPYSVVPPVDFQRAIERGTRTATGEPGPNYWQQWADYQIDARLNPQEKRVEGTVRITYFNHSPDSLNPVYVHLHQNVHAEGAMRNRPVEVTGGVELRRVRARGLTLSHGPGYRVQGTTLSVSLPTALHPNDSLDLEIDWAFTVPQSGMGRMGWSRDNFFFVAYWYPQMAVYDDVVGWHLDPYLGASEFYVGFGNYDLSVTAPPGWLIMATGALQNREEVLPQTIVERLAQAEASDAVVPVITAQDLAAGSATRPGENGSLTWRFHSDSVRDVAFSATSQSLWDAARTPVGDRNGDGDTDYSRVDAIYRATAPKWQQAARYAQHSIDFLSRFTGFSYPWPHMSGVEGADIIGGGMEFPMMTLIGDYNRSSDSALYYVTAHEFAHMWVPMVVNVDERRHAWMDEGTTSFNENQARKEFFPGYNHDLPDQQSYLSIARAEREGEMMRWTDFHYDGMARGIAGYSKPASLLVALRGLLGEETFLRAYRSYIVTWAYHNPKPWDFFNAIEREAGLDLDWFWRSWYYETWLLDQAIASVSSTVDGTRIVVEDLGNVPMPARLAITLDSGEVLRREIAVETWLSGARTAELMIPSGSAVTQVEIDPEHFFPDADRGNNGWRRRT
jgi:hypothetical protein